MQQQRQAAGREGLVCLGPRSPFDNGLACVPNADIQAAERKRTGRMAAAATCNTRPQGGPQLSRLLGARVRRRNSGAPLHPQHTQLESKVALSYT